MDTLTPNPMYIFNNVEEELLIDHYIPLSLRLQFSLATGDLSFSRREPPRNNFKALAKARDYQVYKKIILTCTIPTTLKTPHHIHEDGSMEERPERDGPFRTYYDGSSFLSLGHAVAVCIDKKAGSVTMQCPKGYNMPLSMQVTLRRFFPDFDYITVRAQQQKDQHSCGPLTLYNIFAFAGIKEPKADIDIRTWRAELLSTLEDIEVNAVPGTWQSTAVSVLQEYRKNNKPVAHSRHYVEVPYRHMPASGVPIDWSHLWEPA